MSTASDLRDAVKVELETLLGDDHPVERFILPHYNRESLKDAPRVIVRNGGRYFELMQGGDSVDVLIDVGVVGVGPDHSQSEEDVEYSEAEITQIDEYDAIVEKLLCFWIRRGPLRFKQLAGYQFRGIKQGIWIDVARLKDDGVYLSIFQLRYRAGEK